MKIEFYPPSSENVWVTQISSWVSTRNIKLEEGNRSVKERLIPARWDVEYLQVRG